MPEKVLRVVAILDVIDCDKRLVVLLMFGDCAALNGELPRRLAGRRTTCFLAIFDLRDRVLECGG